MQALGSRPGVAPSSPHARSRSRRDSLLPGRRGSGPASQPLTVAMANGAQPHTAQRRPLASGAALALRAPQLAAPPHALRPLSAHKLAPTDVKSLLDSVEFFIFDCDGAGAPGRARRAARRTLSPAAAPRPAPRLRLRLPRPHFSHTLCESNARATRAGG